VSLPCALKRRTGDTATSRFAKGNQGEREALQDRPLARSVLSRCDTDEVTAIASSNRRFRLAALGTSACKSRWPGKHNARSVVIAHSVGYPALKHRLRLGKTRLRADACILLFTTASLTSSWGECRWYAGLRRAYGITRKVISQWVCERYLNV
jgi:hypothetical protein